MKEPIFYRYIAKPLIIIFVKIFLRPNIIGINNIPKEGRVILAGNHTNNLDSVMVAAINKRVVHFLAKDKLLKGWRKLIFKGMGIIPVNRSIHDKGALNMAIDTLNQEKVIGIFPESTINKTNDIILPFKYGAVKMASVTNSLIVPFVITGSYKILNNNLKIEFLKPIKIPLEEDLTSYNQLLMNIISDKLREEKK